MQPDRDRWTSVGLALLLHALLLAAALYGWMLFRPPPRPMPTLAIEATVVDARTLAGAQRAAPPPPAPATPPPPQQAAPEPQGPPPPSAEDRAQRERQQAVEHQKAQSAAAQKASEEKAEAQAAQAKAADEQRKAAEAKAAQEKKAQEAAQAKEKAEDAQEAAEREADLKRSLASEEHAAAAAATGPALASWQAKITARIERAWIRPPTAKAGIQCMLDVTQEPGGNVTAVTIGDCNGDQAVRESIEVAVYRASPLPPPPDPALFDRKLKINFKPN